MTIFEKKKQNKTQKYQFFKKMTGIFGPVSAQDIMNVALGCFIIHNTKQPWPPRQATSRKRRRRSRPCLLGTMAESRWLLRRGPWLLAQLLVERRLELKVEPSKLPWPQAGHNRDMQVSRRPSQSQARPAVSS